MTFKYKFREKNKEFYIYSKYFVLKLTKLRQVMIKNAEEKQFSIVDGLESPRGMSKQEKEAFLLSIAYGVYQKILSEDRSVAAEDDAIKKQTVEEE